MDGLEHITNRVKKLLDIIKWYKKENSILKDKIKKLEIETNSIQKESEDMLLEVESIIKDKSF